MTLDHLDLRRFARNPDRVVTVISVEVSDESGRMDFKPWLTLGESRLRGTREGHNVGSYLTEGMTDEEHDSAHLLSFDVIGLQWESLDYGATTFTAWVKPRNSPYDKFNVPKADYDPVATGKPCDWCAKEGKPHLITKYLPGHNEELYRALAGRRIQIRVSPPPESEEGS